MGNTNDLIKELEVKLQETQEELEIWKAKYNKIHNDLEHIYSLLGGK